MRKINQAVNHGAGVAGLLLKFASKRKGMTGYRCEHAQRSPQLVSVFEPPVGVSPDGPLSGLRRGK